MIIWITFMVLIMTTAVGDSDDSDYDYGLYYGRDVYDSDFD